MRNGKQRMRGRGGHRGKSQNPLTRVYESNGPDVKIRGTASHIAEKYIQLARDSQSSGDPIAAENYYQHAEHYFRLIAAAQEQFRQQNPYYNQQPQQGQQPQQQGMPQSGGDDSFDEGEEDGIGPNGQNEPYNPHQQQQPQQQHHQQQPQHYQQQPRQHHQQQPREYQNHQQQPRPHYQQNQPQPQPQQGGADGGDIGGLPSFITGAAPQQNPDQNYTGQQNGNGQYGDQRHDRYGRHRRRRHRGPRPDFQGGAPQQGQEPPVNQGGGGDEPPQQPGE